MPIGGRSLHCMLLERRRDIHVRGIRTDHAERTCSPSQEKKTSFPSFESSLMKNGL